MDTTASLFLTNDSSSEVLDSLWAPNSSPSFHGSASMATAERQQELYRTTIDPKVKKEDYEGCCFQQQAPEKKRRLSVEQVQYLEKAFEVENKLEPERKAQLAKELGLQPRQVAIWFQNRRARFKTKVLEKEYDALKSSYDNLKADYDNLLKENERSKNEVNMLKEKVVRKRKASSAAESEGSPRSAVEEGLYEEEELQPNCCNLGFPVQDHGTWFWQY